MAAKTAGAPKAKKGEFIHDPSTDVVVSLNKGRHCRIGIGGKSRHLAVDSEEFWQVVAELGDRSKQFDAEARVLATGAGKDSLWPQVVERLDG
jgi:hypothetical protein